MTPVEPSRSCKPSRSFIGVAALLLIAFAVVWIYSQVQKYDLALGWPVEVLSLYLVIAGCGMLHIAILFVRKDLSTRAARVLGMIVTLTMFAVVVTALLMEGDRQLRFMILSPGGFLAVLIATQGFRKFSLSASIPGLIPLALWYAAFLLWPTSLRFFLVFPLLLAVPLLIPGHRRMGGLWRPPRLPRIRKRKSPAAGYTLIELLIVVSMIAILVAGILPLTSTMQRALERQEVRREALELIRNEAALIRGRSGSIRTGIYPFSTASPQMHPGFSGGEIEIRDEGPAGLREVRFSLRRDEDEREAKAEYVMLVVASNGANP